MFNCTKVDCYASLPNLSWSVHVLRCTIIHTYTHLMTIKSFLTLLFHCYKFLIPLSVKHTIVDTKARKLSIGFFLLITLVKSSGSWNRGLGGFSHPPIIGRRSFVYCKCHPLLHFCCCRQPIAPSPIKNMLNSPWYDLIDNWYGLL